MRDQEALDIRVFLDIALRWWWVIMLVPLLAGLLAYLYSKEQTPIYEAGVTLLLQQSAGANPGLRTLTDIQTSERLTTTYRELITTRPVLEDVVVAMNLANSPESLRGKIRASTVLNTSLLRLFVRDPNPQLAAEMAGTLADVFIRRVQDDQLTQIARLQAAAAARGVTDTSGSLLAAQLATVGSVSVVDPPAVPGVPIAPRTRTNIFVAVVLGFLVGGLVAFGVEYFSDKVRSPEEVEERLKRTHLGLVLRWGSRDVDHFSIMVKEHPRSPFPEA